MRLWLCAVVFGVLTSLLQVPEWGFREIRASLRAHPASGTIAIVDIDDKSLASIGKWPIPRSVYADATTRLFALGARSVSFNLDFASSQDAHEDEQFAAVLRAHPGQVFLPGRLARDSVTGDFQMALPVAPIRDAGPTLNNSFKIDANGNAWKLPYAVTFGGKRYESLSAYLARRRGPTDGLFVVDGSIQLDTIPTISISNVLSGTAPAGLVAGKDVVIGTNSEQIQDIYSVPPYGRIATVFMHVLGAETLLEGTPYDLGCFPAIALAALLMFPVIGMKRGRIAMGATLGLLILMPLLPAALPNTVSINIIPAIAMLLLVGAVQTVRLMRALMTQREQVNQVSGLFNLVALRQLPDQPARRLVVAHIQNFAEVIATLPGDAEAVLIGQIAARLKLGMIEAELYHGDNGVFAWFAGDDLISLGERLDALHALFRSPITVTGHNFDLSVTYGVDDDGSRSVANRLGSALVAAAEATAEGAKWRVFDQATLADAAWKLSLLSQLDAAIDDGHLWVAYQPKLDLVTRRLIGAEALVRWTHPEKGAISPMEFVPAAEQHNRIEKLTMHVLERAVLAAATVNQHDIPFGIAVNLSTRLLESRAVVRAVAEALSAHRLDPDHLTLEITETATLATGISLDVLNELRALGVRISIDDYGTGLSTLDYLKKIPASEIKIDKSFVQSMMTSSSDLLMVNSTIQLAHSLGHIVVAEGVETDEVLARLAEMQCDVAQGYRIGRPMTFQDLARRLLAERKHAA